MPNINFLGAGEFNQLITLEQRNQSTDGYGQKSNTWTELDQVWAKLDWDDGSSAASGKKESIVQKMDATIHYRSDIDSDVRVQVDGDIYQIQSLVPLGRKRYLRLICESYN